MRSNFDTRSSSREKLGAESSVSAEELVSLGMSSSSSSAENTPMSNSGQTVMYMLPFPEPGTPGAPYFSGADVTEFLHRFHRLGKRHGVGDEDLIEMLSDYCEYEKHSHVRAQKNFVKKN